MFVHDDGRVISNAPRKDIPNMTNKTKTNKLNIALVDNWYSVSLPKIIVTKRPSNVKIAIIEIEYRVAFFIPWARVLLLLRKKLTVTGNMAYKHG